jgi:ABC-type transport system substrate-binding protein
VPLGRLRPSAITMRGALVEEGVTRATALRAGEVDVADYVPREHVERLSRAPEMTMLRRRDPQRVARYFNLSKQPFYGAQVRLVILGYGIGRQAIVKTALLGLAQPLWSFVPPQRGADGGGHPPGGA